LVCVSARRRSSKIFGIATVVELKITPPQQVATSRMTKICAMGRASRCRPMVFDFFATGPGSGTSSRNAAPAAIAARPGTKKAARQLQRSISAPDTIAAKASPRLPHRPFQPSARPIFSLPDTSIAMPTG
jgi:hypothetical protein